MAAATPADAPWTIEMIPSLEGEVVIITGAGSGIGLEAARLFAGHGAHVVFAVRGVTKGVQAAAGVPGSTEVRRLDLADLRSVREFAGGWNDPIRVLVNNAGVLVPPLGRTKDGFELQFGTNHLGHFALTNLLLPHITGRVVTVSSSAHKTGHIDFDDLNWTNRNYRGGSAAYSQSKLANLLFTLELQRLLTASRSAILATAAHPGMAATNLGSSSTNRVLNVVAKLAVSLLAQSAADGAMPTVFAAVGAIPGGSYVGPSNRREMTGPPRIAASTPAANGFDSARRLWAISETLTGVAYPLRRA